VAIDVVAGAAVAASVAVVAVGSEALAEAADSVAEAVARVGDCWLSFRAERRGILIFQTEWLTMFSEFQWQ
jgi:hypothetical protein